jgi:hypothetical protein
LKNIDVFQSKGEYVKVSAAKNLKMDALLGFNPGLTKYIWNEGDLLHAAPASLIPQFTLVP